MIYKIVKKIISKIKDLKIFKSKKGLKVLSFFIKPNINFSEMKITENSIFPELYISRTSRLYYYTSGILARINNLQNEYLVRDFNYKFDTDDYLIDIGANIGEFTLGFTKNNNISNVIMIEPDPTEFNILKKQFNKTDLNKTLLNIALSDKNKDSLKFYLNNETGDSSMDNISENFILIKTLSLDHILKEINSIGLIKLEAEGHEPMILKGCNESFKKIKFFTVDVGPELNGKSTYSEVNTILVNNGFEQIDKGLIRETVLYKNKKLV